MGTVTGTNMGVMRKIPRWKETAVALYRCRSLHVCRYTKPCHPFFTYSLGFSRSPPRIARPSPNFSFVFLHPFPPQTFPFISVLLSRRHSTALTFTSSLIRNRLSSQRTFLHELLQVTMDNWKVAVLGDGGVGKTALAVQVRTLCCIPLGTEG